MRQIQIDDHTRYWYSTVNDEVQEMLKAGIAKPVIAKKAGLTLNEFDMVFNGLQGYMKHLSARELKVTLMDLYERISVIYSGYLVKYRELRPERRICYLVGCPSVSKNCGNEASCRSLQKGQDIYGQKEFMEAMNIEEL